MSQYACKAHIEKLRMEAFRLMDQNFTLALAIDRDRDQRKVRSQNLYIYENYLRPKPQTLPLTYFDTRSAIRDLTLI